MEIATLPSSIHIPNNEENIVHEAAHTNNQNYGNGPFRRSPPSSLQLWHETGLMEKVLARPKETQIVLDAYRRLEVRQIEDRTETRRRSLDEPSNGSWHGNDRSSGFTATTTPSRAVFLSSSEAGLGQETIVDALRQHVTGSSHQHHAWLWLQMDCDRGLHPDPHMPAIRALSQWTTQVLSQIKEEFSPRTSTFLAKFTQSLQQSLAYKERLFLLDQVPELNVLFSQYGLSDVNEDTSSITGPSPTVASSLSSSSLRRTLWKSLPSMTSNAAEYSCQKRATLFCPALAKFVYSIAKASAATTSYSANGASRQSAPVVVFENLHRGDEVLLDMLRFLLRAQDIREFEHPYMLVATYQQDSGNYMPECIDLAFNQLKRRQVKKVKINFRPLDKDLLSSRIENIFHLDDDKLIRALLQDGRASSWLMEKHFEKAIVDGTIALDRTTHVWEFQKSLPIETPLSLFGIDQLDQAGLEFLRILACFGMKTNLFLLEKARASDNLDTQLELAVQRGLLVQTSHQEYCFVHESLRNFIYNEIPANERPKFHHQIAENLWFSFDIEELDKNIILVVENLLRGRSCLPNKKRRAAVARLCLRAGELRAQVSAYRSAFFFFSSAIELIADGWDDEYQLCLALHSAACEVANCLGFSEEIFHFADRTIANARSFHDALRVHISKVYTIGSQGGCSKSILYGVSLLSELGEPITLRPSRRQYSQALRRTYRRLRPMATNEMILRLPPMENAEKVSAMRILNALLPYTFNADYHMVPIVVDKMVELTLEYGTSALSGIAFAMLAALQCWAGDFENGQRFGTLALRLTERYQVDAWIGRVATFYFSSVQTWRKPFHESTESMRAARQIALASGDVEFGMINAILTFFLELDLVPIPDLVDTVRDHQETMRKHGQKVNLQMLQPSLLIILSCAGGDEGDVTVMEEAAEEFSKMVDSTTLVAQWHHYARMCVALLFGNIDEACRHRSLCPSLIAHPAGSGDIVMPCFIDGLLAVAICRRQRWKMPFLMLRAHRRIRQLRRFAAASPMNFLGKLHLLQAEVASLMGRNDRAHMLYTSAIVLMREAGFKSQLGLANELAGKHFLRLKDERAGQFLTEADRVYRGWGGIAKADHLVAEIK